MAYGPVLPPEEPGAGSMVGYLAEYAAFHPPLPKQPGEVPGNNVVIDRELLPAAGVLLYRLMTWILVIPTGFLALGIWRQSTRRTAAGSSWN